MTHDISNDPDVPPERRFFYAVHELYRLVRRRFDIVGQPHGLTLPQWRALFQLSKKDGLSQATLAGLTDTDPMTLSGMMERLEAKGLVTRRTDPADSRAKIVVITPQARVLVHEMKAKVEKVQADAFAGISEADRAVTMQTLLRLRDNLAAARKEDETE